MESKLACLQSLPLIIIVPIALASVSTHIHRSMKQKQSRYKHYHPNLFLNKREKNSTVGNNFLLVNISTNIEEKNQFGLYLTLNAKTN